VAFSRISMSSVRSAVRVVLTAFSLGACGGGGDGAAPPAPAPSGSYTLSVSGTTPTTIVQAGSGTATVDVARTGSFAGAVSISVEGAPTGVTVTPSTGTIASGSTSATLAIAVSLNVPAGTYPLTVRGQASGQTDKTAALSLVVVVRPASISLTRATSTAISANAGGQPVNFTLVLGRIEYLGDVTFDLATPLPSGVSIAFAPTSTSGNSTTATMTMSASAAAGSFTAEIRASGTGVTPVVLSVPFTVVGAASLSMSLSRTTLSMPQNGSGVTSVVLTRTNMTNVPVTLSVSALPSGVTAQFADIPVFSNGTSLSFVAGPTTAPGSYPITVSATSTVGAAASTNMTLIVTGANTSGNMSIRFCGTAADIPIWLGYAPGNSWTRIAIGANNTFTFDFGSQGTVAWVTQRGADDFRINIVAGTLDEVAVIASAQCTSPSNRTANGIVSGLAVTDQAQVVFGPRSATTAPTFAAPNFSFTLLPDGALDLAATRSAFDIAAGALTVSKVILQRALNPANGGSIGTLDFNGASAIVPEQKTITAQGLIGGEQLLLSSSFRTAAGTSFSLGSALVATGTTGPIRHLPAAAVQSGDLHTLQASAITTSGGFSIERTVTQTASTPAATTLVFGAVPTDPNVISAASNGSRVRFSSFIPFQSDYTRLYMTAWIQQSGGTRREVMMTVTETMAAITTGNLGVNARLACPNFDSAPGWDPVWENRPGLAATYFVSASGWSVTGGIAAPLTSGTVTKSWSRTGPIQ